MMKKSIGWLCALLCICLVVGGCQATPEAPASTPTNSTTTTAPVTTTTTTSADVFDPTEYPMELRTLDEVAGEMFNVNSTIQVNEKGHLVVLYGGVLTQHSRGDDERMTDLSACDPLATDVEKAWVSGKYALCQGKDNTFFLVNLYNKRYRYPLSLPGELTDDGQAFGHGFEIWDLHGPYIAGRCSFDEEREVSPTFLYHIGTGEIIWLPDSAEVSNGGMLDGKLYYCRRNGKSWQVVEYDIETQTGRDIHEPIPSEETVVCYLDFAGRDMLLTISPSMNGAPETIRYKEYNGDGGWTALDEWPQKTYSQLWYRPADEEERYFVDGGYLYKLPESFFV